MKNLAPVGLPFNPFRARLLGSCWGISPDMVGWSEHPIRTRELPRSPFYGAWYTGIFYYWIYWNILFIAWYTGIFSLQDNLGEDLSGRSQDHCTSERSKPSFNLNFLATGLCPVLWRIWTRNLHNNEKQRDGSIDKWPKTSRVKDKGLRILDRSKIATWNIKV